MCKHVSPLYEHLFWCVTQKLQIDGRFSLLASEVNPAMASTVRLYERHGLYGSPNVRNCRMPNSLG